MPGLLSSATLRRLLVAAAWMLAALVIAAFLGPWISDQVGVTLPAFAMVRTTRRRE